MQPFNQGPGPGPGPRSQPPIGPMPGYPPMGPPPRTSFDIGRIASGATLVAGVIVLFCSLLDLYSITVDPGKVDDSVNGTVEVGMGFYTVVPFNAPVVALAIPILMLVAAVTAIPGLLGRRQGALVSAVSAITATLLGLVMMMSNPLPGVSLSGDLEKDASEELSDIGVKSVDQLVDRVVDIGPGAGLIIAVVFGVLASAAAGIAYWRNGGDEPQKSRGPEFAAPTGPPTGALMPQPSQAQPPVPGWTPATPWTPAPPDRASFQQSPSAPFDSTQTVQKPQPPAGPSGTP
ncbi:hypothetical protein [Gordonia sp. MP11Mi]|uniref:Uncharacterized protein n=1 Tax=Gordonia sp. MP11Mi TaxID=3022769 RepID=A0AA97CW69_9ACTN